MLAHKAVALRYEGLQGLTSANYPGASDPVLRAPADIFHSMENWLAKRSLKAGAYCSPFCS